MSISAEIFDRLREAEEGVLTNEMKLKSHEDQCAIRYGHIHASINSIRGILLWVGGTLLVGMAGILTKLLFFPSVP